MKYIMPKRKTKDEFIKDANEIHNGKYDYSKVEYKNSKTKVCIICPEHGEFWMKPNSHLSGQGCPKCSGVAKLTTEEFVERAKQIHGDKYDYSKVEYKNNRTKVCIICPEHGEFLVIPNDMLHKNVGCRKCNGNYQPKNISEFKDLFFEKHPEYKEKYIISDDNSYINNKTKIKVICCEKDKYGKEHGEFFIRPNDLISGYGCPKCGNNFRKTTEEFIYEANIIHNFKYDYTKTEYKNANNKLCIICHEKDIYGREHGEFWQTPANHLSGCGCPHCNNGRKSKKELEISNILNEYNFSFVRQKTFKWLKYKKNLFLDFFLSDYNIAIEYQGEQHFTTIEKFGGEKDFEIRIKRDNIKKELCEKHNIPIIYLRGKIDKEQLIKQINETSKTKEI